MRKVNSCDGIYKDSLDVRFTRICDNRCPFCIERNGLEGKETNVSRLIQSTIESGKREILILGGEPFCLMKKLEEYVKGIRPYVKRIYITTSLPIDITNDYDTFERIMGNIDGLNVSLQHYNDELNNYAMQASRPHMRINSLLKRICSKEEYANKVRVSINLVKGYIDSEEKLDEFLRKMISIHVKHVKINELQHEEELYVGFERIFKDVLEKEGIELKSPYAHGCQQEITISKYNLLKITVKRACFCVNNTLYANFADMMKAFRKSFRKKQSQQKVLYEDGTLSNGWCILEK